MKQSPRSVNSELLGEAADWMLLFRSSQVGEDQRRAFEQWRVRSPAHEEAWRRADAVINTFSRVPSGIGHNALQSLQGLSRRQLLSLLMISAPAVLITWRGLPWSRWSADIATNTGRRQQFDLADGTHLVLNTSSAVDIVFTAAERRLHLREGEILVATGKDPALTARPFFVETLHGTIRALGTRFSVRLLDHETRVTVFEHAVEVQPEQGDAHVVQAGEQSVFSASAMQPPAPADMMASAWERGMLVAKDMRLADVVAELSRYRRGILRCDPAVAVLPVTGAISLDDTDAALQLLADHLPVRIDRGMFWTTVSAL